MLRCVKPGKFTPGSGRIALQLLEHREPPVGKCVGMKSAELPSARNLQRPLSSQIILGKSWGYTSVSEGWGLRTGSI